jgi:aspartate/tyrosine/aromatic aminotransferase
MKGILAEGLRARSSHFDFLTEQKGMFTYTGMREQEVKQLISEYGIYLPGDGRINVAGLNESNVNYVISSIGRLVHHYTKPKK